MRRVGWRLIEEAAGEAPSGELVVDLSEFAHPDAVASTLPVLVGGDGMVPLLPPDPDDPAWLILARLTSDLVAVDRIASTEDASAVVGALRAAGYRGGVIARLRDGAGLHRAPAIAGVFAEMLRGVWYAPADLVIDYREDPGDLYFTDAPFPRLAAPAWARSRCLCVARAAGVELWGQLDLSFSDAPSGDELDRARALAAADGFDVVVEVAR